MYLHATQNIVFSESILILYSSTIHLTVETENNEPPDYDPYRSSFPVHLNTGKFQFSVKRVFQLPFSHVGIFQLILIQLVVLQQLFPQLLFFLLSFGSLSSDLWYANHKWNEQRSPQFYCNATEDYSIKWKLRWDDKFNYNFYQTFG